MNHHFPDAVMRWLGLAVLCGIGAMLIFGNPIGFSIACDGTDDCLVSWVGALSGWAALGGAVWTIAVMRDQLEEQRRQTDYVLGEAMPEAFMARAIYQEDGDWFPAIDITIINRNRRPFQLVRFESAIVEGIDIGLKEVHVRDDVTQAPFAGTWVHKYVHQIIAGKEDGAPAERCRIRCNIFVNGAVTPLTQNPSSWSQQALTVRLIGNLKDTTDRDVIIEVMGDLNY